MQDFIQKFLFENVGIKGAFVRLHHSCHDAVVHHQYPETINHILYKALAASCLLTSAIKFEGKVIFQLQTNGQAPLILSQCTHHYAVRALARIYHDNLENKPWLGQGTLSIILAPDNTTEKFQGFVDFNQESLSAAVERYFYQSEQLPTKMYLTSDNGGVSGLLLQRMPGISTDDNAIYDECVLLANTLTDQELKAWNAETLLKKLFHEHDIRLFETEKVSFGCSCSEKKIESVLISMGRDELEDILREKAFVEVICDFCSKHYHFDRAAVERLFTE